jgi:hypothetical protein
MIPKSKTGDCSRCPKTNTAVRKRGKDLLCLTCCKSDDVSKQNSRKKVRSLNSFQKDIIPKGTAELQRWFEDRHREMTGTCKHCGGKTEKGKSTFRCSVAHILPKAYFKSVATHPLNWIELCFYNKSCHTNFDNLSLDIMELNCFDEVVEKVTKMYPLLSMEEKRRVPNVLREIIENNR